MSFYKQIVHHNSQKHGLLYLLECKSRGQWIRNSSQRKGKGNKQCHIQALNTLLLFDGNVHVAWLCSKVPMGTKSALVLVAAWYRSGNKLIPVSLTGQGKWLKTFMQPWNITNRYWIVYLFVGFEYSMNWFKKRSMNNKAALVQVMAWHW